MALRYALLGLLGYSPMSGYDLNKMFRDSIDHFWHASISQIYRELGALESKGYLASEIKHQYDKPDKRIYRVTPEGKEAFRRWIDDFPEHHAKSVRDEFSLRLFFGSSIDKPKLLREFERFRHQKKSYLTEIERLSDMAKEYTEKLALFGSEELYWRFILKKARINLEASVRWADECMEELKTEEGQ